MDTLANKNNAFAFDLYKTLSKKPGNLFFSPFSISAALAMTYAGARGNTKSQMARTLYFDTDQARFHPAFSAEMIKIQKAKGENVSVRIANSLFPHIGYPFLKSFIDTVRQNYGVEITPVDYNFPEDARKIINEWVEGKTEQKIKDLIPAGLLDSLVRLVLANAIYFKGNWHSRFSKDYTQNADFRISPAKTICVPLMYQEEHFGYAHFDGMQILEMPYDGKNLAFLAILPEKAENLAALEAKLDETTLRKIEQRLIYDEKIEVYIPRFKLECKFMLNDTLKALGMADAFDSDKADFSGMDGTRELRISHVIHQAFVEVNEEGTEAAAATAVVMKLRAMPTNPVFRADHPFIFMIRDKATDSILFLGRMENPVT